jgi:hypothetical protein
VVNRGDAFGAYHSDQDSCFSPERRKKQMVRGLVDHWQIGKTVIGTYVELHTAAWEMVEDSDRARPFNAVVRLT